MELKAIRPSKDKPARADKFALPLNNFKLGFAPAVESELVIRHLLLNNYRSYWKAIEIYPDMRIAFKIKREFSREILNGLGGVKKRICNGANACNIHLGSGCGP